MKMEFAHRTKLGTEETCSTAWRTVVDWREKRCVLKALSEVPDGASVLVLPCRNARVLPPLKRLGYKITAADLSIYRIATACHYMNSLGEGLISEGDRYEVIDIFDNAFPDDHFDAVVCCGLFHHFREAERRQRALKEFGRICRGPILVSFFCNLAIAATVFRLKKAISSHQPNER